MAGNYTFVIVGMKDNPVYEAEFGQIARTLPSATADKQREDNRHLNQFVIHAAMDVVDELVWTTNSMYLKVVDRFNDWFISAYVTASSVKFMMLHDVRNEDNIKQFFAEVHEFYIKYLMNAFYDPDCPIESKVFDSKVRVLAKKYLA